MTAQPGDGELAAFAERLAAAGRAGGIVALTGAGCSTGSGIPDYRDSDGQWKRPQPMHHQRFMGDGANRLRYWARSYLGWPRVRAAAPNAAHLALGQLQATGWVRTVISQNVDGLHERARAVAAGTSGRSADGIIALHGRLDRVVCMACGRLGCREAMQQRLADAFPDWQPDATPDRAAAAPDGDAVLEPTLSDAAIARLPGCNVCGGIIKPDVVFFGDGVPAATVTSAYQAVATAGALLIVGSSVMVRSALRFVERARQLDVPVFCINLGRTRCEDVLAGRLDRPCEAAMPALADLLGAPPGPAATATAPTAVRAG